MLNRKLSTSLLVTFILVIAAPVCKGASDDFPSKSVRIVVAYAAGGGNDLIARVLSKRLTETLGKTIFVDNRPGATGIIGTEFVAKSPPDGYTLILADTPHVTNPYVYPNVNYDPIKDFEPVTQVGSAPVVLVIYPKSPFQSLGDFVALAKSQPAKITMASGGTGTTSHFSGELFQLRTGIKLVHVPYKGNGPALADVVAGQVQCIFSPVAAAIPLVTAGRLQALAISSARRAASVPDVPTFAEAGIADYRVANWYGVLAPAGTPKPVIALLNKEIGAAVQWPEVKNRLDASLVDVATSTPEEFLAFLKAEAARYSQLIKTVGIKVE